MPQITNGIAQIGFANVGTTNYVALGYTNIDSFQMTTDEGTSTEFFAEEVDAAVFRRTTPGAKTLTFQIMNPDLATIQKLRGGTITGSPGNQTWSAPQAAPVLEQAIRIRTQIGYHMEFPRCAITVVPSPDFGKNSLYMLEVTATILQPNTGASELLIEDNTLNLPIITTQPADTAVDVGDTATFIVAANNAITYQWQVNTGASWTDIAGAVGTSYTTAAATSGMDSYLYRCVVSNGNGSINSDEAELTVN